MLKLAFSLTLYSTAFVAAQQQVDLSNFCATAGGQQVAGQQSQQQACAQTIQGLIPDVGSMVSTLITSPQDGSAVSGAQGFQVTFSTINMVTGLLQDENKDFHKFPQTLDPKTGFIEGGNSVAIQQLAVSFTHLIMIE